MLYKFLHDILILLCKYLRFMLSFSGKFYSYNVTNGYRSVITTLQADIVL